MRGNKTVVCRIKAASRSIATPPLWGANPFQTPPSEVCQVLRKACSQPLARRGTVRVTCHNTMTQAGIEHNYGLLKPRHRSKQLQECTINVALRVMLRIHSQSFTFSSFMYGSLSTIHQHSVIQLCHYLVFLSF